MVSHLFGTKPSSESVVTYSLQWRYNGHDSISNHQPHDCLLNHLFRRRSKKTSRLYVTGLCAGNSPGTGEFPAQMANNAENVSVWWHHHVAIWSIENTFQWNLNKKYKNLKINLKISSAIEQPFCFDLIVFEIYCKPCMSVTLSSFFHVNTMIK